MTVATRRTDAARFNQPRRKVLATGAKSRENLQTTMKTTSIAPILALSLFSTFGCKVQTGVYTPTSSDIAAWNHAFEVLDPDGPSNFGGDSLTTGFTPDPWGFRLTAGGGSNPLDVSTLGIVDASTGTRCSRAMVTRHPDFHFNFRAGVTFSMVRFYVLTENHADATMLINQPDRRWRCNDDHGHSGWGNATMPAIDFLSPQSGRYDIWVGSYDASAHNPATLYVTELDANHP